jgi:lipoate---protein ligase
VKREGQYKARKGVIKISLDEEHEVIKKIIISGDFFLYPEDKLWILEQILTGTRLNREDILNKIREFYDLQKILSPGVTPEDFAEAIVKAA